MFLYEISFLDENQNIHQYWRILSTYLNKANAEFFEKMLDKFLYFSDF